MRGQTNSQSCFHLKSQVEQSIVGWEYLEEEIRSEEKSGGKEN